ncbi:hypothetical protein CC78DRAFT_570053 [Lojkania enalia]|uniref:Transcription factor TFIIIB component B'' Myb domain-containing protein n=1 Tax=Lojkania enalia TaxID=147567 RepID=A0A9P4K5U8_9PLEO|nr:hypothetical protein CC78DRAFT_570053 [Didymosphaeria enalia]
MSSEQQPLGGAKPVTTFSSFINKNTSGRKFAPKVARRRPGAAAASASQAPSIETPTPPVEARSESQDAAQHALPTPAATQEPLLLDAAQSKEPVPDAPPPATDLAPHTIIPTTEATIPPAETVEPRSSVSDVVVVTQRDEDERSRLGGLTKRRWIESSAEEPRVAAATTLDTPTTSTQAEVIVTRTTEPQRQDTAEPTLAQSFEPALPGDTTGRATTGKLTKITEGAVPEFSQNQTGETEAVEIIQPRKGRRHPWATINQPRNEEEGIVEPTEGVQASPKVSRRRQPAAARGTENEDFVLEGEVTTQITAQGTRDRGRKKATDDGVENEVGERLTKKARKPRKDKGIRRTQNAPEGQEDTGRGIADEQPKRKKAQRKRQRNTTETGEGEEELQQPGKRGRRPREATPPEAENKKIEPQDTFMSDLTRDKRVGKLSQREAKMRLINWDEVKEKRRQENALFQDGWNETQNEINARLDAAAEARQADLEKQSGPQFREVNGQIVLIQDSRVIDREGDADREIDLMEHVEEDDLTRRITTNSFVRRRKQYPQEYMGGGLGKRWDAEATEFFYDALQMFGTDFQMISTMFPGSTRKSIKLKFNREERDNPVRIKEALGKKRNLNWDEYLKRAGKKEDSFVDPKEIERQLAEEKERMEVQIAAAKEVYEEEKRQKKLAGIEDSDEEGVEGSSKENKKGRKGKKAVAFEQEEGVEILGSVDDDEYM